MLNEKDNNILILGIGNSGREDDGLGWLFLDRLEETGLDIDLEYRYQLQIEDAELISRYDTVLFVDATKAEIKDGFEFMPCFPSGSYSFTSHELMPETILYLTLKLYNAKPKAFLLTIRGYRWDLKTGLTSDAKKNLEQALMYIEKLFLQKERFSQA